MTISRKALAWTAAISLIAAAWLFFAINANMFGEYDLYADEYVGAPPVWVVLIPLAVGAIAGIAALRASSPQSTQVTDRP